MLLKEEVDPCKYIFRFADEMGFHGRKLRLLSMGDGQEEKARDTIIECSTVSTFDRPDIVHVHIVLSCDCPVFLIQCLVFNYSNLLLQVF